MKILLDTSCLLSIFLRDVHHDRSVHVFEKIACGEIEGVVSLLSIIEFCSVVRRATNEAKALEAKNELMLIITNGNIRILPLSALEDVISMTIKTALKCVDAFILSAAIENNAKLCTFDEEIIKKAKGIVEFYLMP